MRGLRTIGLCGAVAVLLSGCSFGSQPSMPQTAGENLAFYAGGAGKIEHIIYVVQEGRSFDTLFAGYPKAHTVSTGEISTGKRVALQPISLRTRYIIDHSARAMFAACNGSRKLPGTDCRMNGFNKEQTWGAPRRLAYPQYVYVRHQDVKPYFDMAREWVLSDYTFASNLDGDFVAHQYTIAAQADRAVDEPTGIPCHAQAMVRTITQRRRIGGWEVACFNYRTLGGELDHAKLSWRYYEPTHDGTLGAYGAIERFYRNEKYRKDLVEPPTRFLSDVSQGKLANFTWVTPECADSDAVSCGGGRGPDWVAAVVNAVGQSQFWSSTAIFVQWDDWGGFYDDVPPDPLDSDGLGFRVPLLVISPYAKQDYVSHVHYETASILKFAEDVFGLPRMAMADRRANSPAADCFDFSQPPRTFVPIPAPRT